MTTADQIDLCLGSPVGARGLRFKEAESQIDNQELYEYYVAIANEGVPRRYSE
jgi:hypothetical protein